LNLQKENKKLNDELQDISDELNDAHHTIDALTDKLRKADEIIDKLGSENNGLKRELTTAKQSRVEDKNSYGSGSNVYASNSYGTAKVDRTEVNRLEGEVRNLRDQLTEKQQRIRSLEEEISRRPTREVTREVIKEVPVYKSSISSTSTE